MTSNPPNDDTGCNALSGCPPGAVASELPNQARMPESNVEIARRGFEAALSGDVDAMREFLDPDVTWHGGDPSAAGACTNREQALEFMRRARSRRRIGELIEVVDAGDKVVVIMRPPSEDGQPSALSANLTTFRDGKAIEMVHYPNPEDALAAAGV
jgi:ketosteroid isomerase-like protein